MLLSIDEAISKQRKIAETQRLLYEACILKEQNTHFLRQAEEHEQIAEWLEELKEYRKHIKLTEIPEQYKLGFQDGIVNGFENGYNKALDDFANACKENILCQTFGLRECDIEQIEEQLKAGGESGKL